MKRKSERKKAALLLICFLTVVCLTGCISDKQEEIDTEISDITESPDSNEEVEIDTEVSVITESPDSNEEVWENQIERLVEQRAGDIYQMWKKESEHYEKNSYLISQKHKVCRAAVGDLDGDGQEDMAIVLDIEPDLREEEVTVPENTRETFILLRKKEEFNIIARNKGLVMGEEDGGVFGDPFADIVIENGVLTISNYGGSSERWGLDYSFIYNNNNLRLSKIEASSHNTLTACGFIHIYDYLSGKYEQYSECGINEELSGLLLDYGTFDATECYFSFPVGELPLFDGIACLPQAGFYVFQDGQLAEMECTAMEAFDTVKQSYYADAVEQKILWTKEVKDNYIKLLGYPVPDSYFKNQEGSLSYYGIRAYSDENGMDRAEHIIMWEPADNLKEPEYYYVDTVSGKLSQF